MLINCKECIQGAKKQPKFIINISFKLKESIYPPPFEKKIENLKQLQGMQMKQIKEPFCLHANYIVL